MDTLQHINLAWIPLALIGLGAIGALIGALRNHGRRP
jgi:hypothetical protein